MSAPDATGHGATGADVPNPAPTPAPAQASTQGPTPGAAPGRPGPDADGRPAWDHGGTRRRRGDGSGRGGDRPGGRPEEMVPRVEPVSYYGLPVIKRPVWEARDIAGYLFLGGLAGGSSVVAASAELTGRPALARASKVGAAGAITLSAAALIHDLGVPARFANMLRTFKPTSPMSVGSWLLAAYGPAAAVAAASDVSGITPAVGRAATLAAAGVGPAVAAYTGVLLADTAVPAWHEARRHLPHLFVSSAAAAAAGWGLLWSPTAEAAPLCRLAAVAAGAEVAIERRMEGRLGLVGEAYAAGTAGRLLRWARALTLAGGVGGALLGRRSRLAAAASGVALLAGSACTRFGVFEAGMASADDPKHTVTPQRQRRDERARASLSVTP